VNFRAYKFKLDEVEAFKYRAKDAWRAVTRIAVREARLKEIKQEIFNCQKLKVLFENCEMNYCMFVFFLELF
jgi:ATP-dependent RNA helicase DDX56/DBP9